MFEGDDKIFLFLGAAAIGIVMMAGEAYRPSEPPVTAVEVTQLPPLPAGLGADGEPQQTPVARRTVTLGDGFEAELLYGYRIEGTVVTRREYRNDPTSAVSPLDLGIVWGPLAEDERLASMEFNTGPRVVFYSADDTIASVDEWETMVTNNHLLPANAAIHAALMAVEPGQDVQISGYLVEVRGEGIRPWRSSTRRNDNTIIGGCEIILVREVVILDPDRAPEEEPKA